MDNDEMDYLEEIYSCIKEAQEMADDLKYRLENTEFEDKDEKIELENTVNSAIRKIEKFIKDAESFKMKSQN